VAKSKSTKSVKKQSAVSAKRKASSVGTNSTAATTKRAKAAGVAAAPAITSAEIGRVAGDVWGVLDRDGTQTVAAVKKAVDAPADVVAAAIGWLAREDKLEFSASGRAVKISLR
jgi:hypothetical protein